MSFSMRDEIRIAHIIEACREIIEISDVEKAEFDVSKEKQYSLSPSVHGDRRSGKPCIRRVQGRA